MKKYYIFFGLLSAFSVAAIVLNFSTGKSFEKKRDKDNETQAALDHVDRKVEDYWFSVNPSKSNRFNTKSGDVNAVGTAMLPEDLGSLSISEKDSQLVQYYKLSDDQYVLCANFLLNSYSKSTDYDNNLTNHSAVNKSNKTGVSLPIQSTYFKAQFSNYLHKTGSNCYFKQLTE